MVESSESLGGCTRSGRQNATIQRSLEAIVIANSSTISTHGRRIEGMATAHGNGRRRQRGCGRGGYHAKAVRLFEDALGWNGLFLTGNGSLFTQQGNFFIVFIAAAQCRTNNAGRTCLQILTHHIGRVVVERARISVFILFGG